MRHTDSPPAEVPVASSPGMARFQAGPPPASPRVLESHRFGRLEVPPERVVTFPAGLLGFEDLREFLRVAPQTLQPLTFLVACEDPEVAFPVLPATFCLSGYAPVFRPETLEVVGAAPGDPVEILAIVSLAQDTGTLHANLQGPVLINPGTGIGCQVVLHESPYSLRHLLGST